MGLRNISDKCSILDKKLMKIKPKVLIVIQARMNSSQLPGKIMYDFAGAPMLQRLIEKVLPSTKVDGLIVATSTNEKDDIVEKFCKENNFDVFRGSEKNVLSRFISIGLKYNADIIIRLTGDNPFVNAELVDFMTNKFLNKYILIIYQTMVQMYHMVCLLKL